MQQKAIDTDPELVNMQGLMGYRIPSLSGMSKSSQVAGRDLHRGGNRKTVWSRMEDFKETAFSKHNRVAGTINAQQLG